MSQTANTNFFSLYVSPNKVKISNKTGLKQPLRMLRLAKERARKTKL